MPAISNVIAGLALLCAFPSTAYAYIDPGTGAMLIQGLIGGIVAGLFIIRVYWQKLKSFMVRSTGVGISEEDMRAEQRPRAEDD